MPPESLKLVPSIFSFRTAFHPGRLEDLCQIAALSLSMMREFPRCRNEHSERAVVDLQFFQRCLKNQYNSLPTIPFEKQTCITS